MISSPVQQAPACHMRSISEGSPAPQQGQEQAAQAPIICLHYTSLFRGSEGVWSSQKEGVWICVLYPTDACDKGHFLLKTVTPAPGLARILNLLFVKLFISETWTSLEKGNIHAYIIICLCKSTLVFVLNGSIMASRNLVPRCPHHT